MHVKEEMGVKEKRGKCTLEPCLPATAGIATQNDLLASTTNSAVGLVAIFVVCVQSLNKVIL
jgi:hypothetical protein